MKHRSVPLTIGFHFRCQNTKAILLHDGHFEWTTGAVWAAFGYHLDARCEQHQAPAKLRVRPKELTLAGVTVLPPSTQTEIPAETRCTGRSLRKGWADVLAKN